MNKRFATLEKYDITPKRYKELCGFCEQYPEWKRRVKQFEINLKSKKMDGMPFSKTNSTSDETADAAIKIVSIREKIEMIESTAKKASPEFWKYIIDSACCEQPFWYLQDILNMPLSRAAFYDKRRYFYFLLDQIKM